MLTASLTAKSGKTYQTGVPRQTVLFLITDQYCFAPRRVPEADDEGPSEPCLVSLSAGEAGQIGRTPPLVPEALQTFR